MYGLVCKDWFYMVISIPRETKINMILAKGLSTLKPYVSRMPFGSAEMTFLFQLQAVISASGT